LQVCNYFDCWFSRNHAYSTYTLKNTISINSYRHIKYFRGQDFKKLRKYSNFFQYFCFYRQIYLKNDTNHTSACVHVNNPNNVKLSATNACNMYAKVNRNRYAHTRINIFFTCLYPPPESPTYITICPNVGFIYLHVLC